MAIVKESKDNKRYDLAEELYKILEEKLKGKLAAYPNHQFLAGKVRAFQNALTVLEYISNSSYILYASSIMQFVNLTHSLHVKYYNKIKQSYCDLNSG